MRGVDWRLRRMEMREVMMRQRNDGEGNVDTDSRA